MAIISDYEEERNDAEAATSSASKTLPFNATFDSSNPIGIVQTLFDFLANESDFLDKDTNDKEIAAAVKKARDEVKKKKAEEKEREAALKKSRLEEEWKKAEAKTEMVESKSKDEKKEESGAIAAYHK